MKSELSSTGWELDWTSSFKAVLRASSECPGAMAWTLRTMSTSYPPVLSSVGLPREFT